MTYLLAKYALLFLLAAFLGFVLGYWFSRRNFEDVSESFEDLRKANDRSDAMNWDRLWKHLDAISALKETQLAEIYERLDGVSNAVSKLPKPEPVNFASVENRLDSLNEKVRNIPVPLRQKEVDMQPLIDQLDKLENRINAIPTPEKPAPVDLAPVTGKLDRLEAAVRNMPKPEPQRDMDLKSVLSELSTLRNEIKGIPAVETHAPVDIAPVTEQIKSLEHRVNAISRPQTIDLQPVDQRLRSIESEMGRLGRRLQKPARVRPAPRKVTREEPRILKAALYGKKDDLKLISGVGPKLERLLNHNGVFYFWQVASWNSQDINIIDDRLDAFKGRINRDDWVNQAKRLKREPRAAQMPADA